MWCLLSNVCLLAATPVGGRHGRLISCANRCQHPTASSAYYSRSVEIRSAVYCPRVEVLKSTLSLTLLLPSVLVGARGASRSTYVESKQLHQFPLSLVCLRQARDLRKRRRLHRPSPCSRVSRVVLCPLPLLMLAIFVLFCCFVQRMGFRLGKGGRSRNVRNFRRNDL